MSLHIWLFTGILYGILYSTGKPKCFPEVCEPLQQINQAQGVVTGTSDPQPVGQKGPAWGWHLELGVEGSPAGGSP